MADDERVYIAEFVVSGERAVLELFGPEDQARNMVLPAPEHAPASADVFASPNALKSPELMSEILRQCAYLAGEAGAQQIGLPCPSDIELDPAMVDVISREFRYAWMRKKL